MNCPNALSLSAPLRNRCLLLYQLMSAAQGASRLRGQQVSLAADCEIANSLNTMLLGIRDTSL